MISELPSISRPKNVRYNKGKLLGMLGVPRVSRWDVVHKAVREKIIFARRNNEDELAAFWSWAKSVLAKTVNRSCKDCGSVVGPGTVQCRTCLIVRSPAPADELAYRRTRNAREEVKQRRLIHNANARENRRITSERCKAIRASLPESIAWNVAKLCCLLLFCFSTFSEEAIVSRTGGTLRNNYQGWVGFSFVPTNDIIVTALGRWAVAGNYQDHIVKLLDPTKSAIASVNIKATGAGGQFIFSPLTTAQAITGGKTYYVISSEYAGGDFWYDLDQALTESTNLTALASVYTPADGLMYAGDSGKCYGPVSFQFTVQKPIPANPLSIVTWDGPADAKYYTVAASTNRSAPWPVRALRVQSNRVPIGSLLSNLPAATYLISATVTSGDERLSEPSLPFYVAWNPSTTTTRIRPGINPRVTFK